MEMWTDLDLAVHLDPALRELDPFLPLAPPKLNKLAICHGPPLHLDLPHLHLPLRALVVPAELHTHHLPLEFRVRIVRLDVVVPENDRLRSKHDRRCGGLGLCGPGGRERGPRGRGKVRRGHRPAPGCLQQHKQ